MTLDLGEGKLLWQARPIKAPIEKIVANDDFIAIKLTDAAYSYLFALEAAQGQPVFRWKLNVRDATNNPSLLNLALASDGTLVWVMPDRVAGKDLFEPGDVLRFGDAPLAAITPNNPTPPFLSAGGNDQFAIADGRILAVADSGANVWVMSLDQGVMLRGPDGAEMRLSTRARKPAMARRCASSARCCTSPTPARPASSRTTSTSPAGSGTAVAWRT